MKTRFYEYDNKWLYDIKEDKLYDIVDNDCYLSDIDIMKLNKFNPYAEITGRYVVNPYNVCKRRETGKS